MSVPDPLANVLDRLESVKAESKTQWVGKCPAHVDAKPSLSIGLGDDGRVLLHCQAGCPFNAILEALQISASDLYPNSSDPSPNGQRQITATYDYTDTFGVLLFQVVRFKPKQFLQRRPDGDGGWVWNVKSVEKVLYRLQELTRAPDDAMIYIVEGGKDVDRLHAAGLIATCGSGGAGKWKHTNDTPLHGRQVAVIPDNEPAGHGHGQDVARRLHGKAESVRVIELPGLAEHGDVSDWLNIPGNDPEDLDRLASAAPLWEPGTAIVKAEAGTALEPYRAGESMRAINQMAETARQLRKTGNDLAIEISLWLDRRGVETLEGIEHPVAYAAKCVGMGRCNFLAAGRKGRVLRVCSAQHTTVALSDRAIAPLTRLLANRPEAIPGAIRDAGDIARAEARSRHLDKPKAVNTKHVAAAVNKLIGQPPKHTPVHRKTDVGPHFAACEGIREQIAALADAIVGVPTVPTDLRDSIIKWAKHEWCRQ